jgi:hypothetical protein
LPFFPFFPLFCASSVAIHTDKTVAFAVSGLPASVVYSADAYPPYVFLHSSSPTWSLHPSLALVLFMLSPVSVIVIGLPIVRLGIYLPGFLSAKRCAYFSWIWTAFTHTTVLIVMTTTVALISATKHYRELGNIE